jgi:hypothetical protein
MGNGHEGPQGPTSPPQLTSIRQRELLRRLVRAAQIRAVATMLCMVPGVLVVGVITQRVDETLGVLTVFAIPLAVSWLLTEFYCKNAVVCPNCGGSLWSCGTGSFKPRRMKLRSTTCPTCQAIFD